jgi:MFS family permease
MSYKLINNLLGWLMFLVAMVVYSLTLEPSVSLWDCGEFISASDKLQVVHPPGAPLFLLMGRLFSMFSSGGSGVAVSVNMLSATCSALTVLFTFWITTHFARKMVKDETGGGSRIAIFASGIIAALALTFSDSFWFSAVEAEVYAMASFLTALTFWAGLRWEESNSKYADKWLILVAYFIGISIGAHLLSLLVIPAITLIYYFKNYQYTRKGLFVSFLIGLGILFFVQNGIIPGVPSLMAKMDLFFVNSLGFGFNTGSIFTLLLLIGGTAYGIFYFSKRKVNRYANLAFICFGYILLGYSSYAMVVVRSNDNPAIDMNNPEEPFNLLSYVNREQYGDRPLLYGPYFNAQPVDVIEGKTKYRKDKTQYTEIGRNQEYKYDPEYNTFFPRMGDMQKDGSEQGYRSWGGMSDITAQIQGLQGNLQQTQDPKEKERISQEIQALKDIKPKMSNNLSFLFRYQLGHMYFRYFMWNFVGRQNDQQGHDYNKEIEGNWISGINFIDAIRLGPQTDLPPQYENNLARNKYYFLPFILGILGLVFHYKRGKSDAIVTTALFVFTGVLIIIFLNQPPYEPRERDYSLVGSFQTFCIWIGLGVLFIWDKLRSKMAGTSAAMLSGILALSAPAIMGSQGWDDHDRSKRYLGIDFAKDYLTSCPPNAILFTNGDNDTYPLWYAQNVEGIRTDVRIINQSLLPTDWYSQVLLTKVYKSEPLPLTFTKDQLAAGVNEYFQFQDAKSKGPKDLRAFIKEVINGNSQYFSNRSFSVPIDRNAVIAAGVVSEKDSAEIVKQMVIDVPGRGLNKGDLVLLDLIANNAATGWKRPICFTTTSGSEGFMNMEPYFERRGLVYELIPVKSPASRNRVTRINEPVMYDNLMNKYQYSGMNAKKNFYLDDKAMIVPSTLQNLFVSLSGYYLQKISEIKFNDSTMAMPGNKEKIDEYTGKIKSLMEKCQKEIPENVLVTKGEIKFNMAMIYHEIGDTKNAEKNLDELFELSRKDVTYFLKFTGNKKSQYMMELTRDGFDFMERCANTAKEWKNTTLANRYEKINKELQTPVNNFFNME